MVDVKECLPELEDPKFNRETFMDDFDQPMDGINYLINVMSQRHYKLNEEKSIPLQQIVLGIKQDDGFEKVIKFIFEYLTNNNTDKSEREILLYMYLLSDEINHGISEYTEMS